MSYAYIILTPEEAQIKRQETIELYAKKKQLISEYAHSHGYKELNPAIGDLGTDRYFFDYTERKLYSVSATVGFDKNITPQFNTCFNELVLRENNLLK